MARRRGRGSEKDGITVLKNKVDDWKEGQK